VTAAHAPGLDIPTSLAASLSALQPETAANLLTHHFLPAGRIRVTLSKNLSNPCLVLIEKIGPDELGLTFSTRIAVYDQIHTQMLWLVWVIPLLVRAVTSERVPVGKAFLNQWDAAIVPGLAYCAAGDESFLIPDNVFLPTEGYRALKQELAQAETEWERKQPIAFWRGSTTGQVLDPARGWRSLQRVGLCFLSSRRPELLDAGLSNIVQWSESIASEIRQSGLMKGHFPASKLQAFRYLIDVDGNSNAWGGLFERLLTGSTVLKVASPRGFKQWYYARLHPWHHYVPVAADMSDLMDKIEWCKANDTAARRIGENGRALALSMNYESEMETALDVVTAAFAAFSASQFALVKDASARTPDLIFSCHGTVLAYRRMSRQLVHVLPEVALLNSGLQPLVIDAVGDNVYLRVRSGEYVGRINPDGRAALSKTAPKRDAGALSGQRTMIGQEVFYTFSHSGIYVCAEGDGRITVSRKVASTWEHFRVREAIALAT
jgi:hypothetical protein